MSSQAEKVRSRFGFSWSGWNHPLRAQIAAAILLIVGTVASIYLQSELVHQGITFFQQHQFYSTIASVAFMLIVCTVGLAALALVD
ncbi:hypothetical protein [Haladaptatus pallidirubidus]|uniref:ABC transporter permease n=1 Tax=Haladaptatus pallidirubidus TaxID=1008152 RepID=A0AAV3UM83_9EURY|nr:hypothetical protein [Haladaptatus pallidirubidus]